MSTVLMALALGAMSMIIVFIAGMSSGVVRVWTLAFRCCLAFCLTSAACYFILLFAKMFYERQQKEQEQVETELAEEAETEDGFQSMDTNNVPHTGG